MIWIITAFFVGLIVGIIVGVVWTNHAVSNLIGETFGWR